MVTLEKFRWNKRIALVFGRTAEDATVRLQREVLDAQARAVEERDLVIGYIHEQGPSMLDGIVLAPEDAMHLRRRFDVEPGSFHFVLIGKDGGTKRTATEPVNSEDLFQQIDAMPMRRREMQQRADG